MCQWYDDLLSDAQAAVDHLLAEYQPFAGLLYSFTGRILDVGGGSGFARRFTRPDSDYICIDPSEAWLRPGWAALTEHRIRAAFVLGVGEFLPFARNTFDGALAMWSLNHVCEPDTVFKEVSRVLKPGARWLVVFEDVEPTWSDAVGAAILELGGRQGARIQLEAAGRKIVKRKIINLLRRQDWPLQRDHLRIRERELPGWCAGRFHQARRRWLGGFLTYELVNLPKQAADHG